MGARGQKRCARGAPRREHALTPSARLGGAERARERERGRESRREGAGRYGGGQARRRGSRIRPTESASQALRESLGLVETEMILNGSYMNGSALEQRPPWVATTLGCFLIFTIVVDILGNLLVIFSVYRNKKLRNAGTQGAHTHTHSGWACTRAHIHTSPTRSLAWTMLLHSQVPQRFFTSVSSSSKPFH